MIQMPLRFLIELFGSSCFSRQRAHSTVLANFFAHELITQDAQKVCWQGNISGWKNVSKHILHLTLPTSTRSSWMLSSASTVQSSPPGSMSKKLNRSYLNFTSRSSCHFSFLFFVVRNGVFHRFRPTHHDNSTSGAASFRYCVLSHFSCDVFKIIR
jgi:hypothetical protein